MKWLVLVPFFFTTKFKTMLKAASLAAVSDAILLKSRKILAIAIAALISAALFSTGIIIAVIGAINNYGGNPLLSPAQLIGGLSLAVVAGIALFFIFSKKTWQTRSALKQMLRPNARPFIKRDPNTLQDALSMLITDFVKDRQERREIRAQYTSAHSAAPMDSPNQKQYTKTAS